jgi:hypothetical protein
MNTLSCSAKGCKATLSVEGALSPGATYSCRNHTKSSHGSHFQRFQFDSELNGKKKEAIALDRNWGERGVALSPNTKCVHGVYDPWDDQRYCSICRPTVITTVISEVKRTQVGKIGVFENEDEQIDQAISMILFYGNLSDKTRPEWTEMFKQLIEEGVLFEQFGN